MGSSGAFDMLPDEVIHIIFLFADIPALGKIAQTGQNMLSKLACNDETWSNLVERRFRISTKKSRPVLHGGHSWKQAFFSMSHSDRIPRGRYTGSQKAVFAKGRSVQRKPISGTSSPVRLWVLMGHTENCKTRTIRQSRAGASEESSNNERFVELYLCMQNVKSGAGNVTVDVLEATLALLGSTEGSRPLISRVRKPGSSLQPKVLFHDAMSSPSADPFDYDVSSGIKLRPFQVAVVSVHFPCASDVFETDFLARAVSVNVPVRKPSATKGKENIVPAVASSSTMTQEVDASAFFLPEHDVWNYYMELPGNCLTLVDRFQMAVA
jgi:hypothetical protein